MARFSALNGDRSTSMNLHSSSPNPIVLQNIVLSMVALMNSCSG